MTTEYQDAEAFCRAIVEHESRTGHADWLPADRPPSYGYVCQTNDCGFHVELPLNKIRFKDGACARVLSAHLGHQEARKKLFPALRTVVHRLDEIAAEHVSVQPTSWDAIVPLKE